MKDSPENKPICWEDLIDEIAYAWDKYSPQETAYASVIYTSFGKLIITRNYDEYGKCAWAMAEYKDHYRRPLTPRAINRLERFLNLFDPTE